MEDNACGVMYLSFNLTPPPLLTNSTNMKNLNSHGKQPVISESSVLFWALCILLLAIVFSCETKNNSSDSNQKTSISDSTVSDEAALKKKTLCFYKC